MKAAFYKGRGRVFNRLTSWWTRGPYSHMELVLDDGISISSSFMDGGVRFKRIDYSNVANWDFIELGPEPDGIRAAIDPTLDSEYDIRGLLGFVLRRIGDDRHKLFCSEACMQYLGYDETWRFCPNTAAAILRKVEVSNATE